MIINSKTEYQWSDRQDRYILVRQKSINWTGGVGFCKGASSAQEQLQQSQSNFYNTLTQDYSQQFASQNAILSSLTNTLNPIIAAGPNQFGFSTAQTNDLNSTAVQGTGQQYAGASRALREQQASIGGGNSLLPSGVSTAQQSQLASSAANQASSEELGIQNAGYAQGNAMFNQAVGAEEGVAGMYNPAGFAGQATGAGNAAASEANAIQQANAAASPWGAIGGAIGGIATTMMGNPNALSNIGENFSNL
jgi:hypothetical protein